MKRILEAEIDSERINLLFHSASIATSGIIVGYLTLVFALKDLLDSNHLILWSIAVSITLLLRVFVLTHIKRKNSIEPISLKDLQKYEILWSAIAVLTGSIFASALFMPFNYDNLIATMFIVVVLIGLSAGSAISSNASIMVVITFLTVTALPIIFKTIYDGETYFYSIAFMYTFFYIVLIKISIAGNRVVVENLQLKKRAHDASLKDQLTGLWNRRSLEIFIEKLIPKSIRDKKAFSIIVLDIDFFKKYNDNFGHLKGDEALINVAKILQNEIRENDLAIRFGGEEFLIVLPETNVETAQDITKRIIKSVSTNTENTISAGITTSLENLKFEQLVKLADDALYQAKENGRNQFIISK